MIARGRFRKILLLTMLLLPIVLGLLLATDEEKTGARDLQYRPPKGEVVTVFRDAASVHTVYVPVYSHVYFGDGKPYLLTATLSIRNTDLKRPIIVKSVEYYDTDGKLVRSYLKDPLRLGAIASKEILVEELDVDGGSGAKFIVEWTAEEEAERPIIEAVMIGASDLRGISFVTTGKEISGKR